MGILESLHAIQIAKSFYDASKEVFSSKWATARLIVGASAAAVGFAFGSVPGALLGLGVSELFFQTMPPAWHWIENKWRNSFGQAKTVTPIPQMSFQSVVKEPAASNQAGILKGLGQMGNLAQVGHQVVDEVTDGRASTMKVSLPTPRPSAIRCCLEDELKNVTHSLRT